MLFQFFVEQSSYSAIPEIKEKSPFVLKIDFRYQVNNLNYHSEKLLQMYQIEH